MPTKDLTGPPPPDPRAEALMMRVMVRTMPWLDWWPRWRGGGDAAGEPVPTRPSTPPRNGASGAQTRGEEPRQS